MDSVVDNLACMLKVPRYCLHVVSFSTLKTIPQLYRAVFVLIDPFLKVGCSIIRHLLFKGAQSRYFELFWPQTKLLLSGRKPENNSLIR